MRCSLPTWPERRVRSAEPGGRRRHASDRNGSSQEAAVLVRAKDLRGDLHTHTDLTDGIVSLEGMIAAAEARGYEYYAVTDHAPNLVMQRMTDEKMLDAARPSCARSRTPPAWPCCTAASSTSRPTAAWTGTRTS